MPDSTACSVSDVDVLVNSVAQYQNCISWDVWYRGIVWKDVNFDHSTSRACFDTATTHMLCWQEQSGCRLETEGDVLSVNMFVKVKGPYELSI
jgi:hypothetical protein